LTRAFEQDNPQWAQKMKTLLETFNIKVNEAGGILEAKESEKCRLEYRALLKEAEIECPEPDIPKEKRKRGRTKKTKARNLLERLRDFKEDVLRFMNNTNAPFTNNLGENDIRMTKVQQKISGCFLSMEGAKIFCRIRSYLSTCRKHGVNASQALELLLKGKLADFLM
jgi:transposase